MDRSSMSRARRRRNHRRSDLRGMTGPVRPRAVAGLINFINVPGTMGMVEHGRLGMPQIVHC